MIALFRPPLQGVFAFCLMLCTVLPVAAQDQKLRQFLEVTGFDVALESIRLSAGSAPSLLGQDAADFGIQWRRLVEDVFATDVMHGLALEILSETLTDDLLDHATTFYASDLGQRLVRAENASHMVEDDDDKSQTGAEIIDGLVRIGSKRVQILRDLTAASGGIDASIRAIQEVQVRFLMAAAGAGVIDLQMDEPDLREAMKAQEGDIRRSLQANALSGAAYTYQAFSDDEMTAYTKALENPKMQQVYELMNAVQYEVMANRFVAVAVRMRGLQPAQDL